MNDFIDAFSFDGKTYKLTWLPDEPIEKCTPVTQAYGFCFDKEGELLIIKSLNQNNWQVPGGTPEGDETPVEALVREVEEEANAEIEDIHYLGSQKVVEEDGTTYFQFRYAAKVTNLNERKPDPDKGVVIPRQFIDPKDYRKVSGWGPMADDMIKRAKEKLNIS